MKARAPYALVLATSLAALTGCKPRSGAGVKDEGDEQPAATDQGPSPDAQTEEAAPLNAPHKIVACAGGKQLRITPYGDKMVRVQTAMPGKAFVPDDYNETILLEKGGGTLKGNEGDANPVIVAGDITLSITGATCAVSYSVGGRTLLQHRSVTRNGSNTSLDFAPDGSEHFLGLGHDFYGTIGKNRTVDHRLDLRGQTLDRNYGNLEFPQDNAQSPLIVPFYASSKGYGVFVNTFFKNKFTFNANNVYRIDLDSLGRDDEKVEMDYVFIAGPSIPEIVDRYTTLTGRPRLPPLSVLGLQLSDKAHAAEALDKGSNFWREKVAAHRGAGLPIDHLVNDNRWREVPADQKQIATQDGGRCSTLFNWNPDNYGGCRRQGPGQLCSLADWKNFVEREKLTITLDFNRCIARLHGPGHSNFGWQPSFAIANLPKGVEFAESAPDFTNVVVRNWFWRLMFNNTLNPASNGKGLGDGLWIDEFDQMTNIPPETVLKNGRSWFESRNSWFYLISKALIQEGWEKQMPKLGAGEHSNRRPYVWARGQSAGGQRYGSLWSGDIGSPVFFNNNTGNVDRDVGQKFLEMRNQIRGMQAAGASGFAFWGHDAGGFRTLEKSVPGKETIYRVWAMEMGAFAPIFKPHGEGNPDSSRWPLDRGANAQKTARRYMNLRYALMPYTYSLAHEANATGAPMARAMAFSFQNLDRAWQADLQYTWGKDLLVAPITRDPLGAPVVQTPVWIPPGRWTRLWDDQAQDGGNNGRDITNGDDIDNMPLFVRAGAIIPMATPQNAREGFKGTGFMNMDDLDLHVYTGGDGHFTLIRDDGKTEAYMDGTVQRTELDLQGGTLKITGNQQHQYRVFIHGAGGTPCVQVNGQNANVVRAPFNDADSLREMTIGGAQHLVPVVTGVKEGDSVSLCN